MRPVSFIVGAVLYAVALLRGYALVCMPFVVLSLVRFVSCRSLLVVVTVRRHQLCEQASVRRIAAQQGLPVSRAMSSLFHGAFTFARAFAIFLPFDS